MVDFADGVEESGFRAEVRAFLQKHAPDPDLQIGFDRGGESPEARAEYAPPATRAGDAGLDRPALAS